MTPVAEEDLSGDGSVILKQYSIFRANAEPLWYLNSFEALALHTNGEVAYGVMIKGYGNAVEAGSAYWCLNHVSSTLQQQFAQFIIQAYVTADGWYRNDGTPTDTPTLYNVPEYLGTSTEPISIKPEEVAPLFEVAGGVKTMLSVTDTNDEGIVASYEVYADDALVDTVPKAETIDATALGVTAGASVTVKAKSIIDTTSEASNAVIFE
jgi:hypothetical protein